MAIAMQGVLLYSQPASVDLAGKLFTFAVVDANGINVCGAGGNAIGTIVEEGSPAGAPATVQLNGIAKVKTVGNIAVGSRVQSDANGLAESLQSGVPLGVALTAAVAGDVLSIKLY